VQVVIEEPARGGVLFGGRVGGRQSAGVLADQVVEPVPAADRLVEQVLVVERLEAALGGGQGNVIQGGSGPRLDVGAWMQAQAAEQPLLVLGEVGVGQFERRNSPRSAGPAGPGWR
jgi:hypothetical protein